jgi:hypothetical protein
MAVTKIPTTFEEIIRASLTQDASVDYDKKLAENEKKDKFDDHKRAASYKRHLHWIVVTGMWVVGIIVISLVMVRAWHLATPNRLQWLSDGQLHSIDAVLFSSIIFSLASRYFSYYKLFQKHE